MRLLISNQSKQSRVMMESVSAAEVPLTFINRRRKTGKSMSAAKRKETFPE